MAFYLVTVKLKNGETHKGVRENESVYIEQVWLEYNNLANRHYKAGNVVEVIVIQISKKSKEYREWKASLVKPEPPMDPVWEDQERKRRLEQSKSIPGPGKYRARKRDDSNNIGWGQRDTQSKKEEDERKKKDGYV